MKVLHFGAGNIGRGLIAPILIKKNNIKKFIFFDNNEKLINELDKTKKYTIFEIDNNYKKDIVIDTFEIQNLKKLRIISNFENYLEFNLITTSINSVNLKKIINYLVKFIHLYNKHQKAHQIIVMCCENGKNISSFFKKMILKKLKNNQNLLKNFHFVDVLIDRIIPFQNHNLNLQVEKYYSWIINKQQWPSNIKNIKGVLYSKNFSYENDKKLFLLNGLHCVLSWKWLSLFPNQHNVNFLDILKNKIIKSFCKQYVQEIIDILSFKYGISNSLILKFANHIFKRLKNSFVNEPILRLVRNTKLKISKNERIQNPLNFAKQNNLNHFTLKESFKNAKQFLKLNF